MNTLSHMAEHRLYERDRAAWAKCVAPRWAKMLRGASREERVRMWGIACDELRNELTRLAETQRMARRTDPASSHEAAAGMVASGHKSRNIDLIVQYVYAHPGNTSAELAKLTGLERHEAGRRTSDAESDHRIHKIAHGKVCSISGKRVCAWYPGEAPAVPQSDPQDGLRSST